MKHELKRSVAAAGLALFCTIGLGEAQAAAIVASEIGDTASLTGTGFTTFTTTGTGEAATATGTFNATTTANGRALVVLTEGPGRVVSDWLSLIYSSTVVGGGAGVETVTVSWNSDAELGGALLLPTNPIFSPQFVVETGALQGVTDFLRASATASGFSYPSVLTVQAQSDPAEVPEPASLILLGSALLGLGVIRRRRKSV